MGRRRCGLRDLCFGRALRTSGTDRLTDGPATSGGPTEAGQGCRDLGGGPATRLGSLPDAQSLVRPVADMSGHRRRSRWSGCRRPIPGAGLRRAQVGSRHTRGRAQVTHRTAEALVVAFARVRRGPRARQRTSSAQVRTLTDPAGQPHEQLESVLGATPHEFESRILRHCSHRAIRRWAPQRAAGPIDVRGAAPGIRRREATGPGRARGDAVGQRCWYRRRVRAD